MMADEMPWGPMHDPDDPCLTTDGKEITVGMKVVDYDRRQNKVTEPPRIHGAWDPVCWSQAGHHGHWWGCERGTFDGSRMTTRGVE